MMPRFFRTNGVHNGITDGGRKREFWEKESIGKKRGKNRVKKSQWVRVFFVKPGPSGL
jgi:hypothetical protein